MRPLLLAVLALCCGPVLAQPATHRCAPAAADAARQAVSAVLADQVDAWNAADLDRYMAGYARTDSLRFASGGNVRQGWDAALAAYRAGYTDAEAMGTLTFSAPDAAVSDAAAPTEPVRITPLCEQSGAAPRWALAFGRWHLARTGEAADAAPQGLFTLLVERRPEGWRVVHDHTSSASRPAPPAATAPPSDSTTLDEADPSELEEALPGDPSPDGE